MGPAIAGAILATRGGAPRLCANTLVFLAVDKTRLEDLDEAVRRYLAWDSIVGERDKLDLSPHQVKQAETQQAAADGAVDARLPEAYQWMLVPTQSTPKAPVEWQAFRLSGQDALAVRASKKLKNDEFLVTSFAASRLRMELDRVPLWRGDHVAIKQVADDFARYLYLPRLRESSVLVEAIRSGLGLLTWEQVADEVITHLAGLVGARVTLPRSEPPNSAPVASEGAGLGPICTQLKSPRQPNGRRDHVSCSSPVQRRQGHASWETPCESVCSSLG